jgi:hypothetical protein
MSKIIQPARYEHAWDDSMRRASAILQCDCGQEIQLSRFTNTCDCCGADYSMDGARLAPRSQWGEETGERASDVLDL